MTIDEDYDLMRIASDHKVFSVNITVLKMSFAWQKIAVCVYRKPKERQEIHTVSMVCQGFAYPRRIVRKVHFQVTVRYFYAKLNIFQSDCGHLASRPPLMRARMDSEIAELHNGYTPIA